ncbi:MAG: RNA pseudouridine synthase [Bacilli bacterium]|nr:RNA pseudouridine synthase [Bacilli bacterium]
MKNDKLQIIYEDKYLIIVNKPDHMLTISNDKERENTLYHKVYLYLKRKNKNNKIFIIHRLDYDTSGLVVFAKDIKTKTLLQEKWNEVTRKYLAIVNGKVEKNTGTIKSYLKETKTLLVYSSKDKDGQLAITNYRKVFEYNNLSLLEINLKTGRKNQIRVHMSDLGNLILGDKKYGFKTKETRMYLHAYYLKFNHPITNELVEFELDIPKSFLIKLGKM